MSAIASLDSRGAAAPDATTRGARHIDKDIRYGTHARARARAAAAHHGAWVVATSYISCTRSSNSY